MNKFSLQTEFKLVRFSLKRKCEMTTPQKVKDNTIRSIASFPFLAQEKKGMHLNIM